MELQRIYITEFRKEWDKAYENWFGKFRIQAKNPLREYFDGYSTHVFAPQEFFWCHIWNGPHCVFGRTELIPGVTIVSGTNSSPMFFSPAQIVEDFVYADANPFTGRYVPAHSAYWDSLQNIKKKIEDNAQIYPQPSTSYRE